MHPVPARPAFHFLQQLHDALVEVDAYGLNVYRGKKSRWASAGQRLEASSSPVTPEPPDVLEGEYETDDFDGGGGGGLFSTLPPQFDDAFGPRVLPGDDEYVGDDEAPLPEPPPTSSC